MQYCLLMHSQEGGELGLTGEDTAPARAAFARYADDLDAAGVLIGTQVLQSAVVSTTFTARDGTPRVQDGPFADTKERLPPPRRRPTGKPSNSPQTPASPST